MYSLAFTSDLGSNPGSSFSQLFWLGQTILSEPLMRQKCGVLVLLCVSFCNRSTKLGGRHPSVSPKSTSLSGTFSVRGGLSWKHRNLTEIRVFL